MERRNSGGKKNLAKILLLLAKTFGGNVTSENLKELDIWRLSLTDTRLEKI